MPIGASDGDAAVSWKTYRMGLRNCPPVPFVSLHNQIGGKNMSLGKWIPVVIAILTVIADEMDE